MTFQKKILFSLLLLLTGASNNSFCMEQNNKCTCNLNKADFDIAIPAINLSKYQDETCQNNSKICDSVLNLANAQFDTFCTCGEIKNEFINFIKLFTNLYKLKNVKKELIMGNPETKTNGLLAVAVKIANLEIIKLLLKNKININETYTYLNRIFSNQKNKIPFCQALISSKIKYNCTLCNKELNENENKIKETKNKILKIFIQHGLELTSRINKTMSFTHNNNFKIIKTLIKNGFDINKYFIKSETPSFFNKNDYEFNPMETKYFIKNGLEITAEKNKQIISYSYPESKDITKKFYKQSLEINSFLNNLEKEVFIELENETKNSKFIDYFKKSLEKIEKNFLYNEDVSEYDKIKLLNFLAQLDTIKLKIPNDKLKTENFKTFVKHMNEKYNANISIPWKKYISLIPFGFDLIHKFNTIVKLIYKDYICTKDINNRTLPQQMCNYKEHWPRILSRKHGIIFNQDINSINTKNQITHILRNLLTGNLTIENKENHPFLKTISRRILPLNENDNKSYVYNKYHRILMDFIVIFLELEKINLQGAKDAITKGHSILNGNKKVQQTKIHRTRKKARMERKSEFLGSNLANKIIQYIEFDTSTKNAIDSHLENLARVFPKRFKNENIKLPVETDIKNEKITLYFNDLSTCKKAFDYLKDNYTNLFINVKNKKITLELNWDDQNKIKTEAAKNNDENKFGFFKNKQYALSSQYK